MGVLNRGTNTDIMSTNSGNFLLQRTPELFLCDADGNLLMDGKWSYTWDGENRLVKMESSADVPSIARQKLQFAYDSQWRRTEKRVANWNGTDYTPQYTNRFIYDSWNLIAILNPDSSLRTSFMWGTDLSGSLQGSGGVGGLLTMTHCSTNQSITGFATYDGNGNVMSLISATDGSESAAYEYGAFGEAIRVTGSMAKVNPFRFSTKYQDEEAEFLLYAFRTYDPLKGRWLSRDLVNESGIENWLHLSDMDWSGENYELNLYKFSVNNPINYIDGFGLEATDGKKKDDEVAVCPCKCKNVNVATDPKKPGFYNVPDALGDNPRMGMKITITWVIEGDPGLCKYYVNEPDGG